MFFGANCVFPHFVLKHFHCFSKSSAKTTFSAQSVFCYHFGVKTGLVITVSLNLAPKRCFWVQNAVFSIVFCITLRFASFCFQSGVVITLSLNLVPKLRFWLKVCFAIILC